MKLGVAILLAVVPQCTVALQLGAIRPVSSGLTSCPAATPCRSAVEPVMMARPPVDWNEKPLVKIYKTALGAVVKQRRQ